MPGSAVIPSAACWRAWVVLAAADAAAVARCRAELRHQVAGTVAVGSAGHPPLQVVEILRQGLSRIPADADPVVYLDATTIESATSVLGYMLAALRGDAGAVVRGAAVTDALKRVEGDRVVGSVARERVYLPQPPLVIRRAAVEEVLRAAARDAGADVVQLLFSTRHAVLVWDPGVPR